MLKSDGYTLIELLVVIGILALVAAVATPVASAIVQSATARSDTYAVMAALKRYQESAIVHQKTIRLDAPSDFVKALADQHTSVSNATTIDVPEPLVYYADGTSSGGKLVLHHGSHQSTIVVAWLTGMLTQEQP